MNKAEKMLVKKELKKYLLSVIAEEEYYNTIAECKKEVLSVQNYNIMRGYSFAFCCSDWLRGLPIGVEFATYKICVMICKILGWKYDPLFNLGEMTVEVNGKRRKYDTFDLDTIYWDTLGEIIAEG